MYKKIVASMFLVAASVTSALAVPILDLTTVGTAVTAELTPALASAMPIAGTLMAIGIGWRLFRRFVK